MKTLYLAIRVLFMIGVGSAAASEAVSSLQQEAYAPTRFGVPQTIDEYAVIAVLSNDNSACMRRGEKRLILQTQEPNVMDALSAFSTQRLRQMLQTINLVGYAKWGFDLVGPGIAPQKLVDQAAESYRVSKITGCIQLENPLKSTQLSAPSGGEYKHNPPSSGYAIIQNVDAGDYSDDNAQSVFFVAPTVGTNQQVDLYSALLNNVYTNMNYFLQVGLVFKEGRGLVQWADTSVNLVAQDLYLPNTKEPIPYNPDHLYGTLISFQSGIWWMCAGDYQHVDDTWSCHAEPKATGTNLQKTISTSVFAENRNETFGWEEGFSNPWTVLGAKIYRNGVAQDWSSQENSTVDACRSQWLPENVIYGSLAHGGIANFGIIGLPLYCK